MAGGPESGPSSTLTLVLAIWGAVLSTANVLWTIYRGYTDRGRLRVHCYPGRLAAPGVGVVGDNLLVYSVTNVGRRPVVVTSVGGHHKKGEYRAFLLTATNVQFPHTLAPGEYFTAYTDDLSMFDEDVNFLGAWDSLGRIYKAPRRDVRRLEHERRQQH